MITYDDYALKRLEKEIVYSYEGIRGDYTNHENLLEVRKDLINHQALANQEVLLPEIIAFNDALRSALLNMYNHAHNLYAQVSAFEPNIELTARCYFAHKYPPLHPYQHVDRLDLWDALCDMGWNHLYEDGVNASLVLPRDLDVSFESFIGMDSPPLNWNEGLDPELTKGLHLINAFHNLFDHTNFAITDFIFVRDFNMEIIISCEKKICQPE